VHHDERGAASNSIAKSRSDTASSELVAMPRSRAPRDPLAVDRKRRAGERRGAERQPVDALAAIGERSASRASIASYASR
jgi:hypothetical protein